MNFHRKTVLGRTGLRVGRLGISSSFGAPAEAYEEAFDKGCNYFTWGTFIKGRSSEMKKAVKHILARAKREDLVLAFFTYAHSRYLTDVFLNRGLKALGIEYADVLLLGYFPKKPGMRIMDGALSLKEKGLVRFLGLSSHNRKLFPELKEEGLFDVFHVRYSAAHRGAESETFPYMEGEDRPGLVSFTATRWGKLLKQKKIPEGLTAPSASDCYRFALSQPAVDVCMVGARNLQQMRENMAVLDMGPMDDAEMARMRKIGDHVYKA